MTGHCSRLLTLVLVLAALATTVAACGDNDDGASAVDTTNAAADEKWEKVVPGGDCECADGSDFAAGSAA